MRNVFDESKFTPFGLWMRKYLKSSDDGFSITRVDYVIEDFYNKKIMLLEEKQNNGKLHYGQKMTFKVLDRWIYKSAKQYGYDYWGFYVLKFPEGKDMPGPGMTLNDKLVTVEQLYDHLNFQKKFCPPFFINSIEELQ